MFFWPWMIFRTFSLRCWFLSGWKWMKKKQIPTPTDSRKVAGEHISPENWSLNADWEYRESILGGPFEQPRGNLWLMNFWNSIGPNSPHIPRLCGRSRGCAGGLYIYIEPSNYITYPKDRRYSATIFVPHLLCVWFSERRFKKNHIEDGGFHKLNGGTPKWMVYNGKSC